MTRRQRSGSPARRRATSAAVSHVPVGLLGLARKQIAVSGPARAIIASTSAASPRSATATGVAPAAWATMRNMAKACSLNIASSPGPQ